MHYCKVKIIVGQIEVTDADNAGASELSDLAIQTLASNETVSSVCSEQLNAGSSPVVTAVLEIGIGWELALKQQPERKRRSPRSISTRFTNSSCPIVLMKVQGLKPTKLEERMLKLTNIQSSNNQLIISISISLMSM
jgi:hypothetical protein